MTDRVKYTADAAAKLPGRATWRGTALAVAVNSPFRLVRWDGRKAADFVLASKLEPAEPVSA